MDLLLHTVFVVYRNQFYSYGHLNQTLCMKLKMCEVFYKMCFICVVMWTIRNWSDFPCDAIYLIFEESWQHNTQPTDFHRGYKCTGNKNKNLFTCWNKKSPAVGHHSTSVLASAFDMDERAAVDCSWGQPYLWETQNNVWVY